jgi:hypothetical protein
MTYLDQNKDEKKDDKLAHGDEWLLLLLWNWRRLTDSVMAGVCCIYIRAAGVVTVSSPTLLPDDIGTYGQLCLTQAGYLGWGGGYFFPNVITCM